MEHKFNFPETLEFGKSKYGDNGLIAKQNFKKGDVIYEDYFQIFDFNTLPQKIVFDTNLGKIEIDKSIHTAHYIDNLVLLLNYDSFTNHSCDPNTTSFSTDENDITRYNCVALKDINAGEQLTCNYNCFIFDSKDPFECECGAKKCCGRVRGLKNLSVDEQKEIIDLIFPALFKVHNLDPLNK